MKLYYDPVTVNCRKVAAGFGLLGAEFEKSHVDYFSGGHEAPEYVEINPNAALPALVDGDFTLWESNAILQYVADKNEAYAYYPLDPLPNLRRWMTKDVEELPCWKATDVAKMLGMTA